MASSKCKYRLDMWSIVWLNATADRLHDRPPMAVALVGPLEAPNWERNIVLAPAHGDGQS